MPAHLIGVVLLGLSHVGDGQQPHSGVRAHSWGCSEAVLIAPAQVLHDKRQLVDSCADLKRFCAREVHPAKKVALTESCRVLTLA